MSGRLFPPVLTRRRIWLAYGIAVCADVLQFVLGPVGWVFVDDAIDVVAMLLLTLVIGFHPFFIPTFIAELVPLVDMLPTWTGCTAVVIAMRRRQRAPAPSTPPPPPPGVIDV
jgi:hypothetical protein